MKAKLKFDKRLILGFFSQHGEKIAFSVVVVGFLLLVYFAMGGEKFQSSPDDLAGKVQTARSGIEQTDPEVKTPIRDVTERINAVSGAIKAKPYEFTRLFTPPIYEPKTLRGEPALFSPEAFKGTGGLGKFDRAGMGIGAMGNSTPTLGQRWVVVTGIIDNDKYNKSFYDCFKSTRTHDQTDFQPDFRFFVVERVEVTAEDEPVENLKDRWEKPYKSFGEQYKLYPGTMAEADPQFLNPKLVFPLPARKDGLAWGKEVVHAPEIPLANRNPALPGHPATEPTPDQGTDPGEDPFGTNGGTAPGMGPMVGPRPGSNPGGMINPGGLVGPGARPYNPGLVGGAAQNSVAPYLLVRFFDYNVEPGKRYRYRFKVAVTNPNYRYADQDLVKELRERKKDPSQWSEFLYSDWSAPSEVVSVPRDDRLLAASVAPAKGDREPKGQIMAIHWEEQTGDEISDEFDISRGWLANFYDQELPQSGNPAGQLAGAPMAPGQGGPMIGPPGGGPPARRGGRGAAKKPAAPPQETVDYVTEMLVLDMRGGDKLPGKNGLTSPGEFLLLAPDGTLEIRDDSEDREARLVQKDPARAQRQAGPGMFGPGGGMIAPGGGMIAPGGGMFD